MLSDLVKKLYILQDLPFLTGEKRYQEILASRDNVEIRTGIRIKRLLGEESLSGIVTEDRDKKTEEIRLDGLFVAVGHEPQNEAFSEIAKLDEHGYIISGEDCLTETEGIFAAGDCRTKHVRQVSTAAADGAVAALAAVEYIDRG